MMMNKLKELRAKLSKKKKQTTVTPADKKQKRSVVQKLKNAVASMTEKRRRQKKDVAQNKDQAPPATTKKTTTVYVGSAFSKASFDMARGSTSQWPTVSKNAGWWNHTMGWQVLRDAGLLKPFLDKFTNKRFFIENDMTWFDTNNTASPFIHDEIKGMGWTCDGMATNVHIPRFLDTPDTCASQVKTLGDPLRAKGVKTYLLFSVANPDAVKPHYVNIMRNGRLQGMRYWVYVAKRAGCAGVVLDHPALHWNQIPIANDIAIDVAKSTMEAGMEFIWMLNGGSSLSDTRKLMADLKARNVRPDSIVVSHFHQEQYPSIPETGETVTGQALEAVRFYMP